MSTRTFLLGTAILLGVPVLPAPATIIYSGLQNIPIPTNIDGVYLNLDNVASPPPPAGSWDINPFFGGSAFGYEATFRPIVFGSGAVDDPIVRLDAGDEVGPTVPVGMSFAGGFGGSGWPTPHMGAGPNQFVNGSPGFIGFRYTTDANEGPYYGWMRATLTDASVPGLITDWAFENSGQPILVGAVPEPRSALLALSGLAAIALRLRRRD